MTFLSRFINRILDRFVPQISGNVTIVVAFALPVVALAAGGGIDYANVVNARARLQDAADSAAIAAALNSAGDLASQTAAAQKAFKANLDGADLIKTGAGTLTVVTNNNIQTMRFVATATVTTYMPRVINKASLDISATANAGVSINKAEIAFVLDNTGSMNDKTSGATVTKMAALKASLDTTLASLQDSSGGNPGGTKVALVPFDTQVALNNVSSMANYAGGFTAVAQIFTCANLGSATCTALVSNYTELCTGNYLNDCLAHKTDYTDTWSDRGTSYIGVSSASWYALSSPVKKNGTWYYYYTVRQTTTYKVSGSTLVKVDTDTDASYTNSGVYGRPDGYSTYNGSISYTTPSAGGYGSSSTVVYMDNSTILSTDTLLGVSTGNWSGCVIDRAQPYDTQVDAPVASNASTLYPAAKCATNSLLPIMDLTTDIAAARTYAAKMTPAGNTNVTIGIQWGMEVLSPSAPFTGGVDFKDPVVSKYMIVLTDGQNTQNRWSTKASDINVRTALACENAKKAGITIFTVRLADGDSAMLSTCASNTSYYYNLSSSNQLSGTLGSIMKSIKKIRLTQ